jgi:putative PIN family toxin of toxin-antitoxin system
MVPVVVFDTNIFFSAIGWNGRPFACLERARLGAADGVTSQAILDELAEKLREKLAFSEEQIADTLADLLGYMRVVTITEQLAVVAGDPDDDRIVECAVAAGATYIVTGDRRHLLPLGSFRGIAIISAADFLALVPEP